MRSSAAKRTGADYRGAPTHVDHESTGQRLADFPASLIWLYLARMRYEVVLAPSAVETLRSLRAHLRARRRDAIEHLRHLPTLVSKSESSAFGT